MRKETAATSGSRIRRRGKPEIKLADLDFCFSTTKEGLRWVALTSPSSEHVRNKKGDDSVTIRFTRSACDRYTLALVSPWLKYLTPLYELLNLAQPDDARLEPIRGIEGRLL